MNETSLAKYRQMIDTVCIGYSGNAQWEFFKTILQKPEIKSICILGVYYGRDIAYMVSILESLGRTGYEIVGVDKFDDRACNDWPESVRGLNWKQAGFGSAPELKKTRANLSKLGLDTNVFLYGDLAENFLKSTRQVFDFIYIDISHDYETTVKAIELAIDRVKPNGIIGGDDFSDGGTWGVASAVKESFRKFEVFSNWIWLAQPSDYRKQNQKLLEKDNNLKINANSSSSESKNVLVKLLSAYTEEGYLVRVGLNPARVPLDMNAYLSYPFACLFKQNIVDDRPQLAVLSTWGGIAIDEIYFFENVLREFKPKREFLIGIAGGWSTIAFGLINAEASLYGIDNCSEGTEATEGLALTQKIAKKLNINLTICIGASPDDVPQFLERVGGNIDFAFIDGLHTNEQLYVDFECIIPYLSESAIVAFHDVLNWNMLEGFEKVVELALEHNFQHEILQRTASGIGVLCRNISEDVEAAILAFYQDPLFLVSR